MSFIQKLDASGNVIWTSTYDDGDADTFSGIEVDSLGNVYVSGSSGFGLAGGAIRILKYDSNGNLLWENGIGDPGCCNRPQGIELDEFNNVYLTGPFVGNLDFDPNPLTTHYVSSGTCVNGGTFVLKLSENGDYIWAHGMDNFLYSNRNADLLDLDSDGNIYFAAAIQDITDVEPGSGVTELPFVGGTDIALMRLDPNPCVNFYVSMDSLQHGSCFGPGYASATAYNGLGAYDYLWDNVPPSDSSSAYLSTPGISTLIVTDSIGCEFESSVLINTPTTETGFDLNVNLIALNEFFPGDSVHLIVDAFNEGCLLQGGTVSVVLDDPLLVGFTFNPTPSSINGDTVNWDFPPSVYGDPHLIIELSGFTDTIAQIGDFIDIDVIFTPIVGDYDSLNNIRDYSFEVINSYDPNYKSVYPAGVCPENFVVLDTKLTYTVHFQNTGTAPAMNVSILDELDPSLDISSVRVLSQSHTMIMEVLQPNTIDFKFDNIMLADSTSNEPESHGWVVFEVDPLPGVSNWTEVSNSVGIYFDYNEPVLTNTVYTTYIDEIDCNLSLTEDELMDVKLYPNPSTGIFRVELSSAEQWIEYAVVSIEGKLIQSQSDINGDEFEINLSGENRGVYWLILNNGAQRSTIKLVVI